MHFLMIKRDENLLLKKYLFPIKCIPMLCDHVEPIEMYHLGDFKLSAAFLTIVFEKMSTITRCLKT